MKMAVLVWLALVASAAPAFAQRQEPVVRPGSEQRFDELAKWLGEYYAWEKWFEAWGNRVVKNVEGQLILKRKQRPEPPAWLEAECQGELSGADGLLVTACDILRHWDDEPLLILQRRRASVVSSGGKVDDKVVKTSFFQRVHLTGLWMQARYPATPVYGIVGMQVGVIEAGRFTLPAIGAMVVMIPDGEGGHEWKPATTIGFGYRICNFVVPGLNKQASLHFNIARTNVHGGQEQQFSPGMFNVNLFGLSVSAKRR
jgi:hypothetical protein